MICHSEKTLEVEDENSERKGMLKGLRVPPRNLCGVSPCTDCEQQLISALKVSLCLGSSVLSLLRLPMYHRLGGLSNRHLFSHSPAGWEVQGQCASLTGFPVRAFFLAVHCHHSVLVGGQGTGETFLFLAPPLPPETVSRHSYGVGLALSCGF